MTPWEATVYYCDKITELGYQLESGLQSQFQAHIEGSQRTSSWITRWILRITILQTCTHPVAGTVPEHGKANKQGGWNALLLRVKR